MCSARRLIVFNVCVKFQKQIKPVLPFMQSACCITVFNTCVRFNENMSSGFKVMEPTRQL